MPRIELIDPQLPLAQQLRDALRLCRVYLTHWPHDPQVPHYGLLAARLLSEHPEQHTETARLLGQLGSAWPDHPLHADIDTERQRLASPA